MKVLLLGASGGIGSAVRERAAEAGHDLVLFARDPAKLEPLWPHELAVVGNITDAKALADAVSDVDAVVSALGPTANAPDQVSVFETFADALVQAMSYAHVARLVAVSGAACTLPHDRKPITRRLASALVRRAVPFVVEAKQRELDIIAASDLDWTAPRPPRVVERAATGTYRVGPLARGTTITSGDLSNFMIASLAERTYVREAPYISN